MCTAVCHSHKVALSPEGQFSVPLPQEWGACPCSLPHLSEDEQVTIHQQPLLCWICQMPSVQPDLLAERININFCRCRTPGSTPFPQRTTQASPVGSSSPLAQAGCTGELTKMRIREQEEESYQIFCLCFFLARAQFLIVPLRPWTTATHRAEESEGLGLPEPFQP